MKIFIVEDDRTLNEIITKNLQSVGYDVLSFIDGQEAFNNINEYIDVYLVDINIPNVNGLELIKSIKLINKEAKIFIISGDTNIDTILKAYNLGCDDYIKKPFDIREIVAKINHVVLKSSQRIQISKNCYYDFSKKLIKYEDIEIQLTNKEALLFAALINNIGNTVSNEELEYSIWGDLVGNGYTRQLVYKLKKTLPCDIIKNHAANGYRIDKYDNS